MNREEKIESIGDGIVYKDIRMMECDIQEAIEFLEKCCKQWIYIKNICNIYMDSECQQTATYVKFKVRNICVEYESIEIYGEEDEDRIIIDYACIVSTQMTQAKDELLIIVEHVNTEIDIRIKKYTPVLRYRLSEIVQANTNLIITEGKSDWKHLKNALNRFRKQGKYQEFEFEFFEYEDEMGANTLQKVYEYNMLFPNSYFKIFIFDADIAEINEMHKGKKFVYHGNNVFSLVIPVPEFRAHTPLISIENYYTDDEIRTQDDKGYRLYLNEEFNHETGVLNDEERVIDLDVAKHREKGPNYIIDDKVYKFDSEVCISEISKDEIRKKGKNIALSKNKFAENILNSVEPFNHIGHENFRLIFDVIMEIKEKYERIPFDISRQEISERIEVEKGIVINHYPNNLKVMEIHSEAPEMLIGHSRISSSAAEMKLVDNKLQIVLIIENHKYTLNFPVSIDIMEFLYDKMDNPYNRIELFLHEKDRVGIIELFSGDIGSAVIGRMIKV